MPDSADSAQQRLTLITRLSSLPPPQLDQVIFALQPRGGLIPPATAKPGDRAAALLAWAESELGCGVAKVEQVLEAASAGQNQPDLLWTEPVTAVRRDVQVGQDVTGSNVVSGDGNHLEIHHHYGLPETKPNATRQDANEKTLIEAVWTEVEDRLRQSLHNAILIRLNMAEQRNQVTRPWDSQLRTAEQGTKNLAPGTHIADVFDRRDVGGKLLILGNPGAGKTTTMVDLAAVLIQRANNQPDHPMPVMVNLSSWQKANQSITDWLVGELQLQYGVSSKQGQTWLAEKKLLPLLDGLDELPPERQEPVVQSINGWLQSGEGPNRLLVCSRIEEYELYDEKLALNGAVRLEPLTDAQLQAYLASLSMESLWDTLQQDADLLDLVRTPLLLSVSILAKDGIVLERWQQKQSTQARMDYLLDAYVERRLHEGVKSREYLHGDHPTARQIRHWLAWLAQQLEARLEDEFLIEQMQPTMLKTDKQTKLYGLIGGLLFGLILGCIGRSVGGVVPGFIGGAIGILIGGQDYIDPVESFDLSFPRFTRKEFFSVLLGWLIFGLIFGLIFFGLTLSLFRNASLLLEEPALKIVPKPISSIISGLIFGLFFGFIRGLIVGLKTDISLRTKPNQGIWSSLMNAVILLVAAAAILPIPRAILPEVLDRLDSTSIGSIIGITSATILWASIANSILACIQHFSLRVILYYDKAIPWNYARFLNHCTDRLLLQRVGGRYRFIHKLVQEHFAAMK